VDNECILHNSVALAICVPKIIKFGEGLTKFWQKQFGTFLVLPVYTCIFVHFSNWRYVCMLQLLMII